MRIPYIGIAAVCAIIMAMTACSGKKRGNDTLRRQKTIEDAEKNDTFPTPDMRLADVFGPVAEVERICTYGIWTGDSVDISGEKPFMIIKWLLNNRGLLENINVTTNDPDGPMYSRGSVARRDTADSPLQIDVAYRDADGNPLYLKKVTHIWQNGLPVAYKYKDQYSEETHENEFDREGHLSHHTMLVRDGKEGYKQTDTYKYIEFDDRGNWIRRWVRSMGMTVYFDDNGQERGYGDSNRFFSLETRRITYRQPATVR